MEVRLGLRPFKFQNAWFLHKEYYNWMRNEWRCTADLITALREISIKLAAWNKATFGHIFQWKKRNLLRLEGVQRCLDDHITEALL